MDVMTSPLTDDEKRINKPYNAGRGKSTHAATLVERKEYLVAYQVAHKNRCCSQPRHLQAPLQDGG